MRALVRMFALAGVVVSLLLPAVAQAAPCPTPSWRLTLTGVDARLRGLSAVDDEVAWASGSKGTVLRTVDGGRTWRQVAPPNTGALDFRDIQAFDEDRAVVLSIGPGASSGIYRTEDGGAHWSQTFGNTDPNAFYDCIAFFDTRRGLALSDPVDGKFRLVSTVDGGRSWRPVPTEGMPAALPGEGAFAASGQCLSTAGGHDAWIGTGGGATARVLHSADGGRHWEASATPLPSSQSSGVFAVAFRDARHGLAIGGDFANPGSPTPALAVSADRGRTWQGTPQAPRGYRSGVAWSGRRSVVAVGPTGSDLSTDGGAHWTQFDSGSFDTVSCTEDGDCWAAGEKGRVARLIEPDRD
ncbi:oxidoreductase [Solihabitans fulvus]|uniref:Oxidoreductase n=1 Tax=Solihabitans fulvus TaxID=1892852 RepID=A0A5B2XU85_9PSEU|nr:oxidoreductase [Solihabitans fulvus]KAA2266520.1 oxidoreductase [Solihabitans fulvus]